MSIVTLYVPASCWLCIMISEVLHCDWFNGCCPFFTAAVTVLRVIVFCAIVKRIESTSVTVVSLKFHTNLKVHGNSHYHGLNCSRGSPPSHKCFSHAVMKSALCLMHITKLIRWFISTACKTTRKLRMYNDIWRHEADITWTHSCGVWERTRWRDTPHWLMEKAG